MLASFYHTEFDTFLRWSHVFSCDKKPSSRAFMEKYFTPEFLFGDVLELCGMTKDYKSGLMKEVPSVDVLIASIECDGYVPNKRPLRGFREIRIGYV